MGAYDAVSHFLRKKPKPATIVIDGADRVACASGGRWIAAVRDVLDSRDWTRIEALDADGAVLRGIDAVVDTDTPDVEPATVALDSSQIVQIATLLERAADRGAARHAEAYAVAFDRYGDLVQMLAERLTGVENAWNRAMSERANLLADAPAKTPNEDNTLGSMVAGLVPNMTANKCNGAPHA